MELIEHTEEELLLLPDAVSDATTGVEPAAGYNCDRWGHPCRGCVRHSLEPENELPFLEPTEK
jgi:hypothetical protein